MSSANDSRGDAQPKRMIYNVRDRVQAVRNQYWEEGVDGQISDQTHRELAISALQYYDVLYEFRSESVLSDGDFPDISPLRERVGETVPAVRDQSGLGRPAAAEDVPAVTQISVDGILQLTEDLDDLAKKLGFGASAKDATASNEVSESDLRGLVTLRGQDEAEENLPGEVE